MLKLRPRTPQEIKPVLRALEEAGIVLVGGCFRKLFFHLGS